MIAELIEQLLSHGNVDVGAIEEALHRIMQGGVSDAQTAGLLVALRSRERDGRILAACARVMRAHRRAVHPQVRPLIDTCGTGGDRSGTFNISTAAALVVAAAGGAVAKHGNRSVSSKSGSADVLEAAGCALEMDPAQAAKLLDATGFAFLFAPQFHPAMKHVAPVRKALGVRTLFNLLGPLTNPALADRQLIGVFAPELTEVVAEALLALGSEAALVVHSSGLDEVGLHAVTRGHRVQDGKVVPFSLDPSEVGLDTAPLEAVAGGSATENAEILKRILHGERGPCSDVVMLNAGCALEVAGLVKTMRDGVEVAREVLRRGDAARTLARYVESSQRAAKGRAS